MIVDCDFWSFLGMDETRIKAAYKEWLLSLADKEGWLDDDGKIVPAKVAVSLKVSRQVVANWLNETSCISSKMVGEVLCPRLGITPAQFWSQMQQIDARLNNKQVIDMNEYIALQEKKVVLTAEDLFDFLDGLNANQQKLFRQKYLQQLANDWPITY